MEIITQYLGWAAWILLLIPLVLTVRLLVKRSRWSILRMTLVSLTGVAVLALWLHYAETLCTAEPGSYAGALGTYFSSMLQGWVGSTPLSFFIPPPALIYNLSSHPTRCELPQNPPRPAISPSLSSLSPRLSPALFPFLSASPIRCEP